MNFLVVDDSPSMRGAIREMLNMMGHMNVDEADDGTIGLDMLKANAYDLVISDNYMKTMSGIDFLKATRSSPEISGTRFMLVTTENSRETVLEAIKYNVSSYIIKPFNYDGFKEKLKGLGIQPFTREDG
jgi:two-component system chemotaxis response regulator CheY